MDLDLYGDYEEHLFTRDTFFDKLEELYRALNNIAHNMANNAHIQYDFDRYIRISLRLRNVLREYEIYYSISLVPEQSQLSGSAQYQAFGSPLFDALTRIHSELVRMSTNEDPNLEIFIQNVHKIKNIIYSVKIDNSRTRNFFRSLGFTLPDPNNTPSSLGFGKRPRKSTKKSRKPRKSVKKSGKKKQLKKSKGRR